MLLGRTLLWKKPLKIIFQKFLKIYHQNIPIHDKSIQVYNISWFLMSVFLPWLSPRVSSWALPEDPDSRRLCSLGPNAPVQGQRTIVQVEFALHAMLFVECNPAGKWSRPCAELCWEPHSLSLKSETCCAGRSPIEGQAGGMGWGPALFLWVCTAQEGSQYLENSLSSIWENYFCVAPIGFILPLGLSVSSVNMFHLFRKTTCLKMACLTHGLWWMKIKV